jgi:hypothetical protein
MNIDGIIKELRQERDRIDAALTALKRLTSGTGRAGTGRKRRILSAAARKAIGDAQRKRWAKQRRLAKA